MPLLRLQELFSINTDGGLLSQQEVAAVTPNSSGACESRARHDHLRPISAENTNSMIFRNKTHRAFTSFAVPQISFSMKGVPRDENGRILCCGDGSKKNFYTCGMECKNEPRVGGVPKHASRKNRVPPDAMTRPPFDFYKPPEDPSLDTELRFGWPTQEQEDDAIYGKTPGAAGGGPPPSPGQELSYVDAQNRGHVPTFRLPPRLPFGFKKLPEYMNIGHVEEKAPSEWHFNDKTRILR
ncbi:unnamed protein product [Amoebophrya sp. A120]|nr:unnamed protein product [Amoebophrya sp. A120]|eukprot:GSA120T00007594001.1